MAFVERRIRVIIQLANKSGTNQPNKFTNGSDTVTIDNERISVRVSNSGAPVNSTAQVKIYGLAPSLMNQLSTLGLVFDIVPRNRITILAGDLGGAMTTVFSGTINASYGDYAGQPDVPFHFECVQGGFEQVAPAPPTSFAGQAAVADLMSGFARQMSLGFQNNGVSAKLSNPYYSGSIKAQAQQCAQDANIEWGTDGINLFIFPRGGNRNTPSIPEISQEDGLLVSYPGFTQNGVMFKCLFTPQISFGSLVKVKSQVIQGVLTSQSAQISTLRVPKDSTWAVNKMDLALDALVPKGDWLMIINAWNPNYPRPIAQQQG